MKNILSLVVAYTLMAVLLMGISSCKDRKEEEAFDEEETNMEEGHMLGSFKNIDGKMTFTPCADESMPVKPKEGVNLNMLTNAYENMVDKPGDPLYLEVDGEVIEDTLVVEKFLNFQTNSNCP